MKSNSILQLKHMAWGSAGLVVVMLLLSVIHLAAKPRTQAPQPPVVEVAPSGSELFRFMANGSELSLDR